MIVGSYQLGLVAVKVAREGKDFKVEPAWTNKEAASNFASPVAAGGYLYGLGPRQNVYCVEARTGKIAWSQTGLVRASGERAFATFMVMGKQILMLRFVEQRGVRRRMRTGACTCATPKRCSAWNWHPELIPMRG